MEKSFRDPIRSTSQYLGEEDTSQHKRQRSMSKERQVEVTNRLYGDGKEKKKKLKEREEQKAKRDLKKCTFAPNNDKVGASKRINVRLFSGKEGVEMKTTPRNDKSPITPNKSKNELFEYLAYHGVKNQKAAELDKLKEYEELAACTFKPQVGTYGGASTGALKKKTTTDYYSKRDKSTYESKYKKDKDCTFKPTID